MSKATPRVFPSSIFAALLLALPLFLTSCNPPVNPPAPSNDVKSKILLDLAGKVMDIYDAATGQKIDFDLYPGKDYYLAVNTGLMDSIQNKVILYFKQFQAKEPVTRLVEFKFDPNQSETAMLSVAGTPDNLKLWEFNIPDSQILQEIGNFQLMLGYQKTGVVFQMYAFDHYNLVDQTPDQALVVNAGAPLKNLAINVGYYGSVKTNAEITAMINDMVARFSFATKNYGQMTVANLGRLDYPAEGATVAGKVHDYLAWWNSVSHNLAGTTLLPLNPANAADLRLIKMAWYEANKAQLNKDISELFNLASLGNKTVIFCDAGYWAAGGSTFAQSPLYNMASFMQTNAAGQQWGKAPDFGFLSQQDVQLISLHELGHLYGMLHPADIQDGTGDAWNVKVGTQGLEAYGNIMHQGTNKGYNTDRFYVDSDIKKAVTNLDLATTPKLDIPFIAPVGDPLNTSTATVRGQKQANSSITVNGSQVVAADPNTYWAASLALAVGENRLDIAQVNNAQTSHPYILYLTRITDALPAIPALTLTKVYPPSNTVNQGGIIQFEIQAQAQAGLTSIWWWVEKKVNGQYQQVTSLAHWHYLYGTAKVDRLYKTALRDPGEYVIRARARDMAYPTPGQEHQSNIGEISLIVQ